MCDCGVRTVTLSVIAPAEIFHHKIHIDISSSLAFFRNKRFMLDEMYISYNLEATKRQIEGTYYSSLFIFSFTATTYFISPLLMNALNLFVY